MDTFCPLGHRILLVPMSLLGPERCYCPDCDTLYELVLKPVNASAVSAERLAEIKRFALTINARKNVTYHQLVQLGLISE